MILHDLQVDPGDLRRRTGWELKPEGLCKADACIPLPEHDGGSLDAPYLAERLGAPLLEDRESGTWALGPAAGRRALDSADMPDLVLADIRTGEPFDLRSLRGKRVLLIAWASW